MAELFSIVSCILQTVTLFQNMTESLNSYQRCAGDLDKLAVLGQDVSQLNKMNERDDKMERARDFEKLAVLCQAVSQLDEMNKRDGTRPSSI